MDASKAKHLGRLRRHSRVRKKVTGTAERPRLAVYRSSAQIYAQIIDDTSGHTLVSAGSLKVSGVDKTEAAKRVGTQLAERAKAAGITSVVFDRGGYRYHGRVAALADAAREGGLAF
jgi:large subunit ribosomal protein L18